MFKVLMSGKIANVTRTLTLPKTGPLPELELSDIYTIKIDLAGLDAKSPVAKEILKNFPKVLQNDLNATRKRHDDPCVKHWTDAGELISKGKASEDQIKKAAQKAQSEIVKLWNEFNLKSARPRADSIMKGIAESAAKKAREKASVPVVEFRSEDLKENRVGILTAILSAATIGVVAGALGWLIASVAGIAALSKGYKNAWEIAKKQSSDAQDNLNRIDDGLEAALSALKKLEPSLSRLETAQSEAAAGMITAKAELTRMEKDLAALEKRAITEKAVKEGKYLTALRAATGAQAAKIEALRKAVSDQDTLEKSVRAAIASVETASGQVTAKRGRWDKMMTAYTKVSKDSDTFLSTVGKVLKQFK